MDKGEEKKKKKKREEEIRKGKRRSQVWNLSMVLYETMSICMETMGVWNAMILYRKVWNLLSSA